MPRSRFLRLAAAAVAPAVVVAAASPACASDVIVVPTDVSTIQAAIDEAQPGDVVELLDGVYSGEGNVDLDFTGKSITVRGGSGDPDAVIIDCSSIPGSRGFVFDSFERAEARVEALTVAGGGGLQGAAIFCTDGASPTIVDCILRDGDALSGGAVHVSAASPTFIRVTMRGNSALYGGAIETFGGEPKFIACLIESNVATAEGGAVSMVGGRGVLANCLIRDNTANVAGTAMHFRDGAGIRIVNCVVTANDSFFAIGAVRSDDANPQFQNCTVTGNDTAGPATLILDGTDGGSDALFVNCIIHGNGAPAAVAVISGTPWFAACNVEGLSHESWFADPGNIDADPRFVDAEAGDFRLAADSASIDAGYDDWLPQDVADLDDDGDVDEPLPTDLTGASRVQGVRVDMGAFESDSRCPGDIDGDGAGVGFGDLVALLACWGPVSGACDAADLAPAGAGDGVVGFDDLVTLLASWGPCP